VELISPKLSMPTETRPAAAVDALDETAMKAASANEDMIRFIQVTFQGIAGIERCRRDVWRGKVDAIHARRECRNLSVFSNLRMSAVVNFLRTECAISRTAGPFRSCDRADFHSRLLKGRRSSATVHAATKAVIKAFALLVGVAMALTVVTIVWVASRRISARDRQRELNRGRRRLATCRKEIDEDNFLRGGPEPPAAPTPAHNH
jgi:hypothetical protein